MTDLLSRRTLLAGSAGLAGLALSGTPGPAAAQTAAAPAAAAGEAPATAQVPSAYRYKVGDYVVTAIADGMRTFPLPPGFVKNQPKEVVAQALDAAFLSKEQLSIPFTVLMVDTGAKRILIDSGNGPSDGPVGLLPGTLKAIGIPLESIDMVVISHFHADHIGGLLTAEGAPTYPNAQVLVPEKEWAFWMDDGEMSRAAAGAQGTFQNARRIFKPFEGKVERYAWDKEIVDGLMPVGTPGHTPGHTSFNLESDFEQLFVQSDITNIPTLFVRHPTWQVMFDMDGAMAADTRRKTYDRIASERTMVAGYHFPFPSAAYLEKDGDGFRYVPVLWNPTL